MDKTISGVIVTVAMGACGIAPAAEPPEVQVLIDRVIKAAGGMEKLAEPRTYTFRRETKTKNNILPEPATSRLVVYFQPPDKFRREQTSQKDGQPTKDVFVQNGFKSWSMRDGKPQDNFPVVTPRAFDLQYGLGYRTILALKESYNVATSLGESQIGDRKVFGIKLIRKMVNGSTETRMFFDQQTLLLAKSELHDVATSPRKTLG